MVDPHSVQYNSTEVFSSIFVLAKLNDIQAWFSSVRLIYSHSYFQIILSLIAQIWTLNFYCIENNLSNFCVIFSENKKETFRFNRTRLFYFREKPTIPLRYRSKNMEKHFSVKKTFVRRLLESLKHLWKWKKMGETYTKWGTLGWKIARVFLPLWKKIKDTKSEKEWEQNAWRTVEQFLIIFLWIMNK